MSDSNTILNHIISITESRDIEILEMSLLRTISEVIDSRNVIMVKISPGDLQVQNISAYGPDGYKNQYDLDIMHDLKAIADVLIKNFQTEKENVVAAGAASYSLIPVEVLKNPIGFIAAEISAELRLNFHLLEGLVRIYQNYVSILLDNQTDTLTGILNRKTFDDRILKLIDMQKKQKMLAGSTGVERRTGETDRFWLGIFDIDDFKKVNDTFGHIYGDEILILISRIMQYIFRSSDMKFRFGGEEFIIVMKSENSEKAYSVFERFRGEVENYNFPQVGKITVSIGIVEVTGEETPSVFVGCADKALYYAKEHGKNMTCIYADLVEKGLVPPEAKRKTEVILF